MCQSPVSKPSVINVESGSQGDELGVAQVVPRSDTAAITWGGEQGGAASES